MRCMWRSSIKEQPEIHRLGELFFPPQCNLVKWKIQCTSQENGMFSLQVQCEYGASDLKRVADLQSLYAVTNPPPVVAQGAIKVHMRIAKGR